MRSASGMLLAISLACLAGGPGTAPAGEVGVGGSGNSGQAKQGAAPRRPVAGGRVPAGFAARWVGQDGQDRSGLGASVGPDGLQDVHIALSKLTAGAVIKAIRIEGSGKLRWEFGLNPTLLSNAEFIRDAKDPTGGDLYFQPGRDLKGQRLKIIVAYDNEKFETATVVAGQCDVVLRVTQSPLPALNETALAATWLGQDGGKEGSPGDVHVVVTGLPVSSSIVGGVLTDGVRETWVYRGGQRASIVDDPSALPLVVKPGSDGTGADVFFSPYRDESRETMTLRLIAASGQNFIVRFPGQDSDLSLRGARPDPSRIEAKPGDDLQLLADKYGTIALAPGIHRLARPLELNRPVTVTSEGGATLLFDQAATEPPWSSAIKVRCGNTTLRGFAVRFAGPVRWSTEISWGPAVIGMTHSLEPGYDIPKHNVVFTRLDLENPPAANQSGWVEAVRLMRLAAAKSGVIAGNTLRGGPIEFFEGPWRIVDNEFHGTVPGTFSHGVFEAHGPHDLLVRGNRARDRGPSGKTWRFMVLSWQGYGDVIEHNLIEGLGAVESDTIPWSNEPEIILTEAYHINYEGTVMDLSDDGRLLRIGQPQSIPARAGQVVSLLQGPAAGEWRRIVQTIDATTYLVDRPIPKGTRVVSISPGFVGEVFQENRIDMRGGRKSVGLVFVGNHFGTKVVKNHVLGGHSVFKLTACPSETPMIWGWTHAPYLGGVVDGNILEDSEGGGLLGVEHSQYIKSNEGRIYMTAHLENNVVRWSEPFLRRVTARKTMPAGLTIGYEQSHDPAELVVIGGKNRLEAPTAEDRVPTLVVHAANYNARRVVKGRYRLPHGGSTASSAGREASTRSGTGAR
jgi:hypothetical protein